MNLLTTKEVANILKTSEHSVRRLLRNKEIEFFKLNNQYRVLEDDLTYYINKLQNAQKNAPKITISAPAPKNNKKPISFIERYKAGLV